MADLAETLKAFLHLDLSNLGLIMASSYLIRGVEPTWPFHPTLLLIIITTAAAATATTTTTTGFMYRLSGHWILVSDFD